MSLTAQEEKRTRIAELKQAVATLEQEMEKEAAIERAQHELIDHLEDHIDAVETKLVSLRSFWRALKAELAGKREQR